MEALTFWKCVIIGMGLTFGHYFVKILYTLFGTCCEGLGKYLKYMGEHGQSVSVEQYLQESKKKSNVENKIGF